MVKVLQPAQSEDLQFCIRKFFDSTIMSDPEQRDHIYISHTLSEEKTQTACLRVSYYSDGQLINTLIDSRYSETSQSVLYLV